MKRILLIINIVFLFIVDGQTQIDIFTAFNSTFTGRSLSVSISKNHNKHEFGGGIRFNINRLSHPDDQNNTFKKRLYATKPMHYFGLKSFYYYHILKTWKHINPFIFYDLQLTYSTSRNRMFLPFSYDTNGDVLYKEYIEFYGPFTWLEQNVGIGFKANLFSSWYIKQKIGFGTSFIMGYEKKLLGKYFNWFDWDFCYLINVGIGYRFGK